MPELPTGTVTFLLTDVEGSTRLWEEQPTAMRQALARHDALIEAAVEQHGGAVVRPRGEGDSRFAVFARASDAVAAAAAIQQALHTEVWPTPAPLRVRVAMHTGEADLRDGDYYGSAINRCARLRAIAHGGQTLLSQATYDLVRDDLPSGLSLRDLGEHCLADLQRPEQVYQLIALRMPVDFPALRSLESRPNNLPLQMTSFIGREREVAEVTRLLEHTRLLTLTGVGGAGKARLACQVAADALQRFAQGIWVVELAPLAEPALVAQTVAQVLGVRDEAGRPLLATLADALRARHLLLVLDNCEHLLAGCALLVDALLRSCPQVRVLATSREALGIAGETSWRVPSLGLPDVRTAAGLDALTQCEAVRLFVERAAAVQPHFQITPQNATAVAEVCRRLDGIPLAIELAAVRVKALGVEQVAARLDQRFRLLTGGSRTALPRQQTLRALMDWSYGLLAPPEQALFNRLSVFAGGWSLEAAEAVCAGGEIATEDVLDVLVRLVDKSLVLAEVDADGIARYGLLETLRQYGREQLLASGEAGAVHDRHAAYYLALAEQAEREQHGPEQLAWFERLDLEHDNLRAALTWGLGTTPEQAEAWEVPSTPHAVTLGDEPPTLGSSAVRRAAGVRLAGALWWFWFLRGYRREGLHWLDQALAQATTAPSATRAKLLLGTGWIAHHQGDPVRAQQLLDESEAAYRAVGDTCGVALALSGRGWILREPASVRLHSAHAHVDYTRGSALLEESVMLAREANDPWHLAFVLSMQAASADLQVSEERARARQAAEQSLALFQRLDDPLGTAFAQRAAGQVALLEHNYERARAAFAAELAWGRALGDSAGDGDHADPSGPRGPGPARPYGSRSLL
jgi:predicted ATPase/class 3 adenylate cyclase